LQLKLYYFVFNQMVHWFITLFSNYIKCKILFSSPFSVKYALAFNKILLNYYPKNQYTTLHDTTISFIDFNRYLLLISCLVLNEENNFNIVNAIIILFFNSGSVPKIKTLNEGLKKKVFVNVNPSVRESKIWPKILHQT
jgi:hypothetical protein